MSSTVRISNTGLGGVDAAGDMPAELGTPAPRMASNTVGGTPPLVRRMISDDESWNLVLAPERIWLRITVSATLACTSSRIVSLLSVPSSFFAEGAGGTVAAGEGFGSSLGGSVTAAGGAGVTGGCATCRWGLSPCILLHHPPTTNIMPSPM